MNEKYDGDLGLQLTPNDGGSKPDIFPETSHRSAKKGRTTDDEDDDDDDDEEDDEDVAANPSKNIITDSKPKVCYACFSVIEAAFYLNTGQHVDSYEAFGVYRLIVAHVDACKIKIRKVNGSYHLTRNNKPICENRLSKIIDTLSKELKNYIEDGEREEKEELKKKEMKRDIGYLI